MSYTNRFGIEVYHSDEELINDLTENSDMSYDDEHYQESKIAYDGALIPAVDAMARMDRDRALSEKYTAAEKALDDEQMTWTNVEEELHPEGKNHRTV